MKEAEMGRMCSSYGEQTNMYRILDRKPQGMGLLERTRYKWW
jgi:hypothetical protein